MFTKNMAAGQLESAFSEIGCKRYNYYGEDVVTRSRTLFRIIYIADGKDSGYRTLVLLIM